MRLAGIDIGTNTLRLLISEFSADGKYNATDSGRHITRLGEGLSYSGCLKGEAMERTLSVLKEYAGRCRGNHVDGINAAATSAVREAANGPVFIRRIKEETGIDVNVIPGGEEARLTMLGVSSALEISGHDALLMDIGGGSTELIMVSKGEIEFKKSTDIGVVRLTEQYIRTDPPDLNEMELIETAIEDRLQREGCFVALKNSGRTSAGVEFIGTAGTVTTLAAIDQGMDEYDTTKINGYRMKRSSIRRMLEMLSDMTNMERMAIPGIEEGREDIIIAGALAASGIMEWFGFDEITVSDAGLREGLVVDLYQRMLKHGQRPFN